MNILCSNICDCVFENEDGNDQSNGSASASASAINVSEDDTGENGLEWDGLNLSSSMKQFFGFGERNRNLAVVLE